MENTVLPFSLGKYHYIIPINTGMLCGPHSSAGIGIIYSKSVRSKRQRTNCLFALRKVKYIDSDERRGKVYKILCQPLTSHSPTIHRHMFLENLQSSFNVTRAYTMCERSRGIWNRVSRMYRRNKLQDFRKYELRDLFTLPFHTNKFGQQTTTDTLPVRDGHFYQLMTWIINQDMDHVRN